MIYLPWPVLRPATAEWPDEAAALPGYILLSRVQPEGLRLVERGHNLQHAGVNAFRCSAREGFLRNDVSLDANKRKRNLHIGPPEARIDEGGFDAFAALANRYVGHAHHDEVARRAGRVHVGFDIEPLFVQLWR